MMGSRPVREQELEKVKQQEILELPGSHETMNSLGTMFSDLLQLGLPLDFYNNYVSQVAALTVSEIEQAAAKLLDPRQMVWLVVGDRTELEPALRELKISDILAADA